MFIIRKLCKRKTGNSVDNIIYWQELILSLISFVSVVYLNLMIIIYNKNNNNPEPKDWTEIMVLTWKMLNYPEVIFLSLHPNHINEHYIVIIITSENDYIRIKIISTLIMFREKVFLVLYFFSSYHQIVTWIPCIFTVCQCLLYKECSD